MRKIIQRTKGFEKALLKLQPKFRLKFLDRLKLFIEDEFHPFLKTHELKGHRRSEWSFSVTNDIRAIYRKEIHDGKTVIIFTFIDIGAHSKVY